MTDNEKLFRIIWPERCWHTWAETLDEETDTYYIAPDELCEKCGTRYYVWQGNNPRSLQRCNDNPTFAHSDEIATAMVEVGLWEEFVEWHRKQDFYVAQAYWRMYGTDDIEWIHSILKSASAEILVTPDLLKRAIISWREGR